ncbi:hypothetical protein TRVA0_028S01882 [Trichomonascus vanleenenianus]|uniref:uncharacterized protein n=1 Tax=Trichomonascus vanleenenianus TaxID=2268995 RepID=UPI003ECAD847
MSLPWCETSIVVWGLTALTTCVVGFQLVAIARMRSLSRLCKRIAPIDEKSIVAGPTDVEKGLLQSTIAEELEAEASFQRQRLILTAMWSLSMGLTALVALGAFFSGFKATSSPAAAIYWIILGATPNATLIFITRQHLKGQLLS